MRDGFRFLFFCKSVFLGHPNVHICNNIQYTYYTYLEIDTSQVNQWMGVWVSLQDGSKEGRAGGEDHLVGLDLKQLQLKISYLRDTTRGKD